jgi:hypothetical protein
MVGHFILWVKGWFNKPHLASITSSKSQCRGTSVVKTGTNQEKTTSPRKDDISLARVTKAIHVFSTSWHRRRLFTYPSCGGMVIPFHNYRGRNKDVPI